MGGQAIAPGKYPLNKRGTERTSNLLLYLWGHWALVKSATKPTPIFLNSRKLLSHSLWGGVILEGMAPGFKAAPLSHPCSMLVPPKGLQRWALDGPFSLKQSQCFFEYCV